MARTRGTRRLPPHSYYEETQKRSPQEIAAGVAPTLDQYQLAFDYHDEETILAFLTLTPHIQTAMDATNAYVLDHQAVPPAPRDDGVSNRTDQLDNASTHLWLWSCPAGRLRRPVTLFRSAARRGFLDVVQWFFVGSRDRRTRLGAILTLVLPQMLRVAVQFNQPQVVETLLTSSVFHELQSLASQQRVLHKAIVDTTDAAMYGLLVAHGACVVNLPEETHLSVFDARALALGTCDQLLLVEAIRRDDRETAIDCIRHVIVVDAAVVVAAVKAVNAWAVKRLLLDGFADVNACSPTSGLTPLMECAITWGPWTVRRSLDEHCDVVRVLLEHHADMTLQDPLGRTALYLAIEKSNLPCVRVLLDHAVETVGIESIHRDRTVLELAYAQRNANDDAPHVLAALLVRGACPHIVDELHHAHPDEVLSAVVNEALSESRPCHRCSRITSETFHDTRKRKRDDEGTSSTCDTASLHYRRRRHEQ